jgi:probable F420-dependent oxidoreductase
MSSRPPVFFASLGFHGVEDALSLAKQADRLGFGGVTIADHLFMPDIKPGDYPYSSDGNPPFPLDVPWPDDWALASAVAAVTSRVEIMTSVYILPLRHPLIVARAVGTAAIVAKGRLTLGIGVGWLKEEFDALGVDFSKRGAMADEAIVALRTLWESSPATHNGRYFSFGPLFLEPRPETPIPIIVGGTSGAALRRAARHGDGYIVPSMSAMEDMLETAHRLRGAVAAADRDSNAFRTCVVCLGRDSVDELCRFAEGGANALMVRPYAGLDTIQEKLDALERFASERIPAVYERLGFPAHS